MLVAVASLILGLLGLFTFWWFPTAGLLFGLLSAASGLLGRRSLATTADGRSTAEQGMTVGIALGAAAAVGSLLVVVITTW